MAPPAETLPPLFRKEPTCGLTIVRQLDPEHLAVFRN
jgi:hypothetical protein